MPLLSGWAREKELNYFFSSVPKDAKILEIGCGDGWLGQRLRHKGWRNYTGLDQKEPADILGDIRNWRALGLTPSSFDIVAAFQVVEHVDCLKDCYDLLRPGGRLFLTSPVPRFDKLSKLFEWLHLFQRRTSPHSNLIDFYSIPYFTQQNIKIVAGISQWGIFIK